MKILFNLILLGIVGMCISCSSNSPQKLNVLSENEKAQGWELLYNGENLDNWKTFNGGKVAGWKIKDGILYNSGVGTDHGGDIISRKEFANFEIYLEWKIAPESNSGVFFRVQEGIVDVIYESGPEYQLLDDKGWPTKLDAHQYSGANYAMQAPVGAEVVPIDEWNKSKIIVDGAHVENWLNGKKVVEYELWTEEWLKLKSESKWKDAPNYGMSKSGHIGLQDHGGLTMFRNIKIREL